MELVMARNKKDDVISWLRDAHAMEAATVRNLEQLIGRAEDYPSLKAQLQKHLQVSRRQVTDVEAQLKTLGADTSMLKDLAMRFTGWIEPFLGALAPDEMPKHCLAAHGWENFEIASYRSLLGAAEELGMQDLKGLCERAIREEQEMATYLFDNLPDITRQYLRGK
jgi:ferritin-like metal-binding protein YciE